MVKTTKLIAVAILSLYFLVAGCSTSEKTSEPQLLQTAREIHEQVAELRGNPQEKMLRQDWPPLAYRVVEDAYIYTLPYIPYLVYNSMLIYTKESICLPVGLVIGGTPYQDQSDEWVARQSLRYQDGFNTFWPDENSHANCLNMDEWPSKE